MNFYDFSEIRERGNCVKFITSVLGERVSDGRCRAIWRGGSNPTSVSVSPEEWYDHSQKSGGGIIELCAVSKFSGDVQRAQDFLGEWLHLEPKKGLSKRRASTRMDALVSQGYKEVERYYYTDEEGAARVIVVRMEHPEKAKEFIQETPSGARPKDVEQVLYNLPVITLAPWVIITEGEKDANTLIRWSLPATTCIGGSKKWQESYNRFFDGKDVVISRDNDEAGIGHARMVARSLAHLAKSIRILCPSSLAKGDVTDWVNREGGTKDAFLLLVKNAPQLSKEEALWSDEEAQLIKAKEANETPLSNTVAVSKVIDGKTKRVEEPITLCDLAQSIHDRFLGFPRRLGDTRMFDHDKDSGRIEFLDNKSAVFAWMGMKSKRAIHWGRASGAVTKDELYEGLMQTAIRYESISLVPDYPRRDDVYYAYREKIKPSPGNECFNRLMDFFNPANEASRILLRALFAAPIYFRHGIRRPCWIIDSESGPGVGKSTVAELLGELYRCSPIKTNKHELQYDFKELLKRVVSSEGRSSRILVVDNVTGIFDNPNFAAMVTDFGISGKAPYGRGEETRPNNLTYIITANSANINNDIASRSFGIMLARPTWNANWATDVINYVKTYRYTIFGDIIEIISRNRGKVKPMTRIPEFEQEILWPMCQNESEYAAAISGIMAQREEANVEQEIARQCGEIIALKLQELFGAGHYAENIVAFIRYEIIDLWLSDLRPHTKMQDVRNYAKIGLIKEIDTEIRRYPKSGTGPRSALRSTGLMWIGRDCTKENFKHVVIIGRGGSGNKAEKIDSVWDQAILEQLPACMTVVPESITVTKEPVEVAPQSLLPMAEADSRHCIEDDPFSIGELPPL